MVTGCSNRAPPLDPEQVARNLEVAHAVVVDQSYRVPWRSDAEMNRFRGEMVAATARQPHGFPLAPRDRPAAPETTSFPWFDASLPL